MKFKCINQPTITGFKEDKIIPGITVGKSYYGVIYLSTIKVFNDNMEWVDYPLCEKSVTFFEPVE